MEGVVFETKTVLTDLKTHGCNVDRLRIMGGASKSRVWSGIIAAVTGCQTSCQTSCMKEPEACCMGAAIIAAVGSGAYHNYQEAVSQMVKTESIDKVDLETLQFYIQKYEEYQQLFRLIEKYTKERY